VIFSFVVAKSTRYVLTNQRIVETRFGKIVKEIVLADFMGKPISQFLDKQAAGTVNEQPVYNVRITNPRSLDIIEFRSLNESAVEALERILERARQVVRCEYCNTSNSAASFVCSRCGAPLRWSIWDTGFELLRRALCGERQEACEEGWNWTNWSLKFNREFLDKS
jgi:DNA replicative helicase MCM subunit Mcm2 (Cdc46/Mcm family)